MLKELNIINYQSHSDTKLEFVKGINVIVGTTDSGKTAILRALKWLMENRPLGSAYIKQGEGGCCVELVTENGTARREKGDDNYYRINNSTFRSFGSGVPTDINNVLSISEINWLSQLGGPYLVLESSGEIAKEINRALNLDLIDGCTSEANSKLRDLSKTLKLYREQRDKAELEIKNFDGFDDLVSDIVKLQEDNINLDHTVDCFDALTQLVSEIQTAWEELEKDEEEAISDEDYVPIYEGIVGVRALIVKYDEVFHLVTAIDETKRILQSANNLVASLDSDAECKRSEYEHILNEAGCCPFCGQPIEQDTCERLGSML